MESPHAEAAPPVEASFIDWDGPPSSPFVTEVEMQSRNASKRWNEEPFSDIVEERVAPVDMATPNKAAPTPLFDASEDKENIPQEETTATLKKIFVSPEKPRTPQRLSPEKPSTPQHTSPVKPSTPQHVSPAKPCTPQRMSPAKASTPQHIPTKSRSPEPSAAPETERRDSVDSDLMPPPPPSTRKAHTTPRKTPSKPSRSVANTPRPLSSGNSYEGATPAKEQVSSAFQAGLDMRDFAVPQGDATSVDDTCFSTFSEIPDMTIFARLGQSPAKRSDMLRTPRGNTEPTPRTTRKRASTSRSPSPTSRRLKTPGTQNQDGTTSYLIDFTQQFEGVNSYRPTSPGKFATESNLLQYMNNQRSPNKMGARQGYATPSKSNSILNLLDFELPPAPTPRSIPTITVRELESLKSSYLSQISSLEATLSGRKAEVESLKKAVGDAERRVGEAQEAVRDEKNRREHVEQEKAGWERRGHEVEAVLQSVKEEVMKSETEKDDLLRQMEDGERRVDAAEERAAKAEDRFADALAARASTGAEGDSNGTEEQVQRLVAAQIDAKIEAVSRELHSVYKEKHERKVATLKKSYEARSEKKLADLQHRLSSAQQQNEELLASKDATFTNPGLPVAGDAELKAELEEYKAALARLDISLQTSREQQEQLMRELQQERIEKGDLVAAVDEMLALQSSNSNASAGQAAAQGQAMSVVEDFRKSISRPSGLRAPASGSGGVSRIGAVGRTGSGGAGGKSRILANIHAMGRAGAGGVGAGAGAME
ncbi:hypothetical protein LTR08_007764 [Meristemomyces frigidus]|nr:hypothetical protein LTR08_007764 [Meristemomyces frigidus]